MTVSTRRSDHHDDVLDAGEEREARRRPSRSALAAAGAATALAAALVVQVVGGADAGGQPGAVPVSMGGSLALSNFFSESFGPERGWGDSQERNATGSGRVVLELPDRRLEGIARIDFEASYTGDESKGYFHGWGDIHLQFWSPTVECTGSFGVTKFKDPPEGGGSMHARCDDGAVLAARMFETQEPSGLAVLTIDLRDGWYVAGPEQDS